MNDTETRLRDYFAAKAGTVEDTAQGPGLELHDTSARRRWVPTVLAAAAIGAVLILTVPFLTSLSNDHPDPAGSPPKPVTTEAPLVPYSVTINDNPNEPITAWWSRLHDDGKTVKNPGVEGQVLARLGDGWLVMTSVLDPKKSQPAIIRPDGAITPLGPAGSRPFISPDRRQIATMISVYGQKTSRLVVVDVETGKQVSSLVVKLPAMDVSGWNRDGIWMTHQNKDLKPVLLWKPGSPDAQQVPNVRGYLAMTPGGSQVVHSTTKPNGTGFRNCQEIGSLRENRLVVEREFCYESVKAAYPVLSPDGRVMVHDVEKIALDLATGKTTKLRIPGEIEGHEGIKFEDESTVIVVTATEDKQHLVRCSIVTGECKVVATAKTTETFHLVSP